MDEKNMRYETEIDLKKLCIYILRSWKSIIIALILGIIIFGGLKAISDPKLVEDSALIEENQTKIAEYQSAQSTSRSDISTNESTIASNETQIRTNEAAIKDQREVLNDLQDVLHTHEQVLDELQVLMETDLSSDEQAVFLDKISGMTERIYDLNSEIAAVKGKITAYESENEKLQQSNESLEAGNVTLAETIENQQAEIDALTAAMEPKEVPVSMSDIVKNAVIGAFVGVFIVCAWLCVRYLFGKKMKDEQDLLGRYGYYILGNFYSANPKQKDGINRLLDKWAGIRRNQDEDEEYRLVAAKIRMSRDEQPVRLMVTGTLPVETLEQVGKTLEHLLPAAQYQVCVAENLTYNAETLTAIKQYEVVLVEKKDVSDLREIEKLADILRVGHVRVVGAVVL